jgi:RHS repeat-associated protein
MMSSAICAANSCFSRYRYTGKERDTESGNDYFGARYYASSMGRFMSPDPSGLVYWTAR